MKKKAMYKNIILTSVTVVCMFLFVMVFYSKASAGVEISDQESQVTYKQVMVHEGDCLYTDFCWYGHSLFQSDQFPVYGSDYIFE